MKKIKRFSSVVTLTLFLFTLLVVPTRASKVIASTTTDFTNLQAPITASALFSGNSTSITTKIGQDVTVNVNINASDLTTTGPTITKTPRDIVLVLDISNSMGSDYPMQNGKTKLSALKVSAKTFVDKFVNNDSVKIAVVAYSSLVEKKSNFCSTNAEKTNLKTYIDNLVNAGNRTLNGVPLGGTNIGDGLRIANDLLGSESSNVQKNILLMTDGYANFCTYYNNGWGGSYLTNSTDTVYPRYLGDDYYHDYGQTYAKMMGEIIKPANINSFMIGFFTQREDSSYLKDIANSAGGKLLTANDSTTLDAAFTDSAAAMNADYTAKDLKYTISIPLGLSVKGTLPDGVTLSNGKLTYSLGDVGYNLQTDNKTYKPIGQFPKSLSFTLTASKEGTYTLGDGVVAYTDFCNQSQSKKLDPLTLNISNYDLGIPTLTEFSGKTDISKFKNRYKSATLLATKWGVDVQDKYYSVDGGNSWQAYPSNGLPIDKNCTILVQGTRKGESANKSLPSARFDVVNIDNMGPTGKVKFVNNNNGTVTASIDDLVDEWTLDPSLACTTFTVTYGEKHITGTAQTIPIELDPTTGKPTVSASFTCSDDLGNESIITGTDNGDQGNLKVER